MWSVSTVPAAPAGSPLSAAPDRPLWRYSAVSAAPAPNPDPAPAPAPSRHSAFFDPPPVYPAPPSIAPAAAAASSESRSLPTGPVPTPPGDPVNPVAGAGASSHMASVAGHGAGGQAPPYVPIVVGPDGQAYIHVSQLQSLSAGAPSGSAAGGTPGPAHFDQGSDRGHLGPPGGTPAYHGEGPRVGGGVPQMETHRPFYTLESLDSAAAALGAGPGAVGVGAAGMFPGVPPHHAAYGQAGMMYPPQDAYNALPPRREPMGAHYGAPPRGPPPPMRTTVYPQGASTYDQMGGGPGGPGGQHWGPASGQRRNTWDRPESLRGYVPSSRGRALGEGALPMGALRGALRGAPLPVQKPLQPKTECKLCRVTLGEKEMAMHLAGKRHKKAEEERDAGAQRKKDEAEGKTAGAGKEMDTGTAGAAAAAAADAAASGSTEKGAEGAKGPAEAASGPPVAVNGTSEETPEGAKAGAGLENGAQNAPEESAVKAGGSAAGGDAPPADAVAGASQQGNGVEAAAEGGEPSEAPKKGDAPQAVEAKAGSEVNAGGENGKAGGTGSDAARPQKKTWASFPCKVCPNVTIASEEVFHSHSKGRKHQWYQAIKEGRVPRGPPPSGVPTPNPGPPRPARFDPPRFPPVGYPGGVPGHAPQEPPGPYMVQQAPMARALAPPAAGPGYDGGPYWGPPQDMMMRKRPGELLTPWDAKRR